MVYCSGACAVGALGLRTGRGKKQIFGLHTYVRREFVPTLTDWSSNEIYTTDTVVDM